MSGTRLQLPSGSLYTESHGDPDAPLLLAVHGLSANCRSFDRFLPALTAAQRHVVTMDLRGRGHSDVTAAGSYGWANHIADLLALADHFGAERFDLVGHSMGGFIGMALAAAHPQRCATLVSLDALGVPEPASLTAIAKSVGRLGAQFPSREAALAAIRAGAVIEWNTFWDNYFDWELEPVDGAAVRIRTDLGAITEDSVYATTQDVYALWPQLHCPVLVVRASTPIGGGLIVTAADAARFPAVAESGSVLDVPADHYTVLLDAAAIAAVSAFLTA